MKINLFFASRGHNGAMQKLAFDPTLIARYDRPGPRYTSYPTAVQFHPGFGEEQYRAPRVGRCRCISICRFATPSVSIALATRS